VYNEIVSFSLSFFSPFADRNRQSVSQQITSSIAKSRAQQKNVLLRNEGDATCADTIEVNMQITFLSPALLLAENIAKKEHTNNLQIKQAIEHLGDENVVFIDCYPFFPSPMCERRRYRENNSVGAMPPRYQTLRLGNDSRLLWDV
jgi:hypothetical protein